MGYLEDQEEKRKILKEIKEKYKIELLTSNTFENSLFLFYKKKQFLTKKQIAAIKKDNYQGSYFDRSEEDSLRASVHDHGSQ